MSLNPSTGWAIIHINLLYNFYCLFAKTKINEKRPRIAKDGPFLRTESIQFAENKSDKLLAIAVVG